MNATFARLWEESKAAHRSDVERVANTHSPRLEKFWTRAIEFLTSLVGAASPTNRIRVQLAEILSEYLPLIRQQVIDIETYFNQWEEENCSYGVGSRRAAEAENHAKAEAKRLSEEMLRKISDLPGYKYFYRLPLNPRGLVANPYPGYLSSGHSVRYCDFLLRTYCK